MKKIAFQGIHGAFHEEAIAKWQEEPMQTIPCMTFEEVVRSVEEGICEYGMMAIENSIAGPIASNLELIARAGVTVCGEVVLRIRQCLGALPGISLYELTEVRSHYMAIRQCRSFFASFPNIRLVEEQDTALSARNIAREKLKYAGAIASRKAILHYGLNILAEEIESNPDNHTRFLVICSPRNKRGEKKIF
jgi:prephenate dehydratase